MKFVMQGPIKRQNYPKGKRDSEHMFELTIHEDGTHIFFANKTYAAEHLCFNKSNKENRDLGKRVETLQDAKDIAHTLGITDVSFRWKNSNLGSRSTYYYDTHEVVLGRQAQVWVVLHELAHHLSPQRGHTNLFRGSYLRLLRMYGGQNWSDKMKDCFRQVGIGYEFPTYRGK